MALTAAQYRRGGANGGITDADGRGFRINTGGIADTLGTTNSAAAPGAGATVASISVPPAGVYRVSGAIMLTGTAETAVKNLRISHAATISDLPSISGAVVPFAFERVTCNGTNSINFFSVAAATAGSVYTLTATATRVE